MKQFLKEFKKMINFEDLVKKIEIKILHCQLVFVKYFSTSLPAMG